MSITHYFGNGNYTVPTGKRLYLLSSYNGTPSIDYVTVDLPQGKPLILNSGQLLSSPSLSSFNGYLVDENYFADCGGGGSSITNSSSGPNFINPILITNTLCGSGNLLNDSIRINVDSILGQTISSLIIHSDFSGPSIYNTNNNHNINLDVSSYNGIFSTPIFSIITQLDGIG